METINVVVNDSEQQLYKQTNVKEEFLFQLSVSIGSSELTSIAGYLVNTEVINNNNSSKSIHK